MGEAELQMQVQDLEMQLEALSRRMEEEEDKKQKLQGEIDAGNARVAEIATELEAMPELNVREHKMRADLYDITNVELEQEVKAAEQRLQEATREAQLHTKAFEQTRQ